MYYDALKTFVTLAEVKNFTKTAERLRISQPSVSLHIKNLEKEFQTQLFIRSPKFLQITPTGELLYDRAKQILTVYEQARQQILEHHTTIKGELKIGASFTIGEYILPALLFQLQKNHQELQLQVLIGNTEEIVSSVRNYKVDIGLIEGQTNEKEVSVQPFMKDELFIVSSPNHPLASKGKVTMDDLQNQKWVSREAGSGTRDYLNHVIRSNGLKTKSILTISSNQGIKESVIHGLGLSLLSKSVIERDLQSGNLSIIKINQHTFHRKLSYIYAPLVQENRNVSAFLQVIHQAYPSVI